MPTGANILGERQPVYPAFGIQSEEFELIPTPETIVREERVKRMSERDDEQVLALRGHALEKLREIPQRESPIVESP